MEGRKMVKINLLPERAGGGNLAETGESIMDFLVQPPLAIFLWAKMAMNSK